MGPAPAATASLEVALAHATRLLEAEPVLAEEQATEILRAVGDHPRALHVLAMARVRQGDDQAAVGVLGPLARDCPRWAQAHADLGAALSRLGRADEAVAALRHAATLQPELPGAWLALADALRANGDTTGAGVACLQHVRHSAKDPRLLAIGKALFENRLPEAEERLRTHLGHAPNDIAAIRMQAEVDARLGRDDDALALLARCLELAPGFHAARKNLAQVLNRGNRQPEALAEVEALIAADPANPGYRNLKAVILGRFVPIVRTFVPFVAGAAQMTSPSFVFYNVIGALTWVGLCLGAGLLFGNVPAVRENFSLVTIGIVGVSVLPAIVEFVRHRAARRGKEGVS